MRKMLVCWVILIVSAVSTLTYIGLRYENMTKEYQILEVDLVEAADIYIKINDIKLSTSEEFTIKTEELLEQNIIKTMDVGEDTCEGYINVKKNISKINYKAYIKCREYTTADYEE